MFEGRLHAIYITPQKAEALVRVQSVRAVAGRGLEGDRYFASEGTFKTKKQIDQEVTLIELEAIEAVASEAGIVIEPGQARRNLVTRNVPLNHLVGKEFSVGAVRLFGHRLCEPCGHLEKLAGAGLKDALWHRGGLRAQVLTDGVLQTGDSIRLEPRG